MPNLAQSEIALTGLSLAGRGARVLCGLSCREVPYPLSPGMGSGPGLAQSLLLPLAQGCCCVARLEVAPVAASSLQACWKHPVLPNPIPGRAQNCRILNRRAVDRQGRLVVGVFFKSPLIPAFPFFPLNL